MAEPVTADEQRMAVPRDVAARISRLSLRKVDYWARTRLVEPTVDTRGSTGRVRLYGFLDLLALVVAAELNARGVSVQHIRQVVGHLKSRGYNRPLSELTFATVGNRVYFQHDDGTWEGGLRPDQLVPRELLDLEPLRQRIAAGARRDDALVGKVERRRGALGNKPLLAGTRVPVETVQRYLAAGRSTDDVLEATLHKLAAGLGVEVTGLLGDPPTLSNVEAESPALVVVRRAIMPSPLTVTPKSDGAEPLSLDLLKAETAEGWTLYHAAEFGRLSWWTWLLLDVARACTNVGDAEGAMKALKLASRN